MKFMGFSKSRGYNLPPCQLLKLCGYHVLLDCPLDLSAVTIFSPILFNSSGKPDTSSCPSSYTLDPGFLDQRREKANKLLEINNLIPAEPYYKTVDGLHLWNVSLIDIVLISSPMGMLGLPFLTRTEGFSAKIYATEATAKLGQLLMVDLVAMHMEFKQFYGPNESSFLQLIKWEELDSLPLAMKEIILGKDGTELGSWMPLYSAADVRNCLEKVQALKYAEEACYNGTLIIKALSSGLEIGSCNWTLKDPKRTIAYLSSSVFSSGVAADFDFSALQGSDILIYSDFSSLDGASCSALAMSDLRIMSSTDTWDVNAESLINSDGRSEEMDKLNFVCSKSIDSVKAGGSVLIPIGQLGIVLLLLEQLALSLESSNLKIPIFIISSVAEELIAYINIIPEWLCKHRQEKLYSGEPVFTHTELIKEKRLHIFPVVHSRELLLIWQEPCIVFCPHWSLRLGPVVPLLQRWHGDQNSMLILEEGVDADLTLLPFEPIEMKVLQCSFTSGTELQKVPQLFKLLQPKLVLLPDYVKPYFDPLRDSPHFVFYSESEILHVPKLKNLSELYISTDLASQLTQSMLKREELTISRLKGEHFVDGGKHYLLPGKQPTSSDVSPLMHWGKLDLQSLTVALQKMGIKASLEQVKNKDGSQGASTLLHVFEPSKGLIGVKETSTIVTTADENLACLISNAIDRVLDHI